MTLPDEEPTDRPPTRADVEQRLKAVKEALEGRWPEDRIAPTLDRVRGVTRLLGDPQQAYPSLHVAGTNGKTSTVRMIDALLRAFGLSTGRFTSPHLESMLERIALLDESIEPERLIDVYNDVIPYIEIIDAQSIGQGGPALSTFEVYTVLALATFADAPVDVAVVEVGMGGSWDATNVLDGDVAVITPIGLDHAAYLGDTIEEVAGEKAGIIKPDQRVVIGVQEPDAMAVLNARIAEVGAEAVREGIDFGLAERRVAVGGQMLAIQGLGGRYDEIFLPLHGEHQARNAAVALAAVESFLGGGVAPLDVDIVRDGFAQASSPGRLEVVRRSPTVVLDGAHNEAGAKALAAALSDAFDFRRLVLVLGANADKDVAAMVEALGPHVDLVVATASNSSRALSAEDVGDIASELLGDERVVVADRLTDALELALEEADTGDDLGGTGVVVAGSLILVGQARSLLAGLSA